jgi:hypothetical protein
METIFKLLKRLNINNLFPGILIFGEFVVLSKIKFTLIQNDFFTALFILVVCYSVGLINHILSRMIIDPISERITRPLFLDWFAHIGLDSAKENFKDDVDFTEDLKNESTHFLFFKCKIKQWNSVYRATLRKASKNDELDFRRNQGRYLRDLLIPIIVSLFIFANDCNINLICNILIIIGIVLITVILYSGSELTTFAEANDIISKSKK